MNSPTSLPSLTKGNAVDRKEAYEARMRDPDYSYAVQTGLSIRGNWRSRARRERLAIERVNEADAEFEAETEVMG